MKSTFFLLLFASFCLLACTDKNIETIKVKDDNGILTEQFTRNKKDFAKQGLYQNFYPNGTIKEESHYQNNQLDGVRKFFYANGTIESEESFRNGVQSGVYKKFYPNGTLSLEMFYVNGVLTGVSKGFYENGVLKEQVNFKENEENGPFVEYYDNCNLKAKGSYLDGPNEHDSLYIYDVSGQLERVMFCQSGICHTAYGKKPE
jgi:antitoxin component YwqK of YwqJK toxin-antitoxin module